MSKWIDADALRDRFQNLAYDDWNQGTGTTWANAFAEAADVVDDMPTADVAPVRHGQMRYKAAYKGAEFGFYLCSECGQPFWWGSLNYCPHCGAKMDGGGDDSET